MNVEGSLRREYACGPFPPSQGQGLRIKATLSVVGTGVLALPIVRAGTKPSTAHPGRGPGLVLGPSPRAFLGPILRRLAQCWGAMRPKGRGAISTSPRGEGARKGESFGSGMAFDSLKDVPIKSQGPAPWPPTNLPTCHCSHSLELSSKL